MATNLALAALSFAALSQENTQGPSDQKKVRASKKFRKKRKAEKKRRKQGRKKK